MLLGEQVMDLVDEEREWLDELGAGECASEVTEAYSSALDAAEEAASRLFEVSDDLGTARLRAEDALHGPVAGPRRQPTWSSSTRSKPSEIRTFRCHAWRPPGVLAMLDLPGAYFGGRRAATAAMSDASATSGEWPVALDGLPSAAGVQQMDF